MSQDILTIISGFGAVAALFAAGFWFRASILEVPDNIDTFLGKLQRISRINACGGCPRRWRPIAVLDWPIIAVLDWPIKDTSLDRRSGKAA